MTPPLRTPRALLFLLAFLTLVTCAARRTPESPVPSLVADAATRGGTDRKGAIAELEDYLAGNPDSEIEPWAAVWAGEQRRLAGDFDVARRWFERAADKFPTHQAKNAAVLGMALVDARSALSGNTVATLQLIGEDGVPDTMNADRFRLLARLGHDEGTPARKVKDHAHKAHEYAASDPVVAERVDLALADLLTPATELRENDADEPLGAEAAAVKRARDALRVGDLPAARTAAETVLATFPDSEHAREMRYLLRRVEAGNKTVPGRVGVLLPLSGEYAPPGARLKDVITYANRRSGDSMELRFIDTKGDPDATVAALEKLVIEDGCVAVLGPLLRVSAMPAAEAAQALGVPMVALSQSAEPQTAGDWVYRGFLTLDDQIEALLDHAMGVRGMQRFGVLYPENSYGETARDLFVAEVQRRGGEVKAVASYDENATDFRKAAQALGKKDYTARANEFWRIKKDFERDGQDPAKAMLPPIIEYEALFVPDSFRRVRLVTSALAYEEFPVGRFKPRRESVPLLLLGLNGWNNDALVEGGGMYVEDSIFVDAFLPGDDDPGVHDFVAGYTEAFSRPPMVLDAVTYDAAMLLAEAVAESRSDRDAIRDLLLTVTLDRAASGGHRFGEDREVERRLAVLTIADGGIRPWTPPAVEPPPDGGTEPE